MGKPTICKGENKGAVTAKLISALDFATQIVQFLYFQNPKFPASNLQASLCRTRLEPKLLIFSHTGSYFNFVLQDSVSIFILLVTDRIQVLKHDST